MEISTPSALHPVLQDYKSQLDRAGDGFRALAHAMNQAQINWHVEPAKWSIGQHLLHLTIVAQLYHPFMEKAITQARANGLLSDGPYESTWIGRKLIAASEPPVKRRYPSPKGMQPPDVADVRFALPEFLHWQEKIAALAVDANGVDLGRAKLRSPATALVRLTLGDAFGLLAAHTRRHLWHSWQIRNHADFPSV